MRRMHSYLGHWVALVLLSGSIISLPSAPTFAATTNITRQGRYYQVDGQYRFLSAYDTQELHADTTVDYRAKLDTIQQHGIRKIRLWLYPYWDPNYLAPWVYSNGRYNLDRWNDSYWSRLRDVVREAQSRGIVVEVSLFSANVVDESKDWGSSTYRPAWNRDFNVNGAFSSNGSGHFVPQFFQVAYAENGRGVFSTQQQLLMKTVNELRDFPNVMIEICNEWPGNGPSVADTYAWQQTMANEVRTRTNQLVVVHAHKYTGDHTDGLEHFGGMASVDILNFHTGTDPNVLSRVLAPAWNYGKPIQSNEGADPYTDVTAVTRGAWGYLMAGGASYAAYEDKAGRIGSAQWAAGAQRLRVLSQLAEANQFWTLSPFDSNGNQIDNLITATPGSDWQLIASPGQRYLAYIWNAPTANALRIILPTGSYSYTWYDPRTGTSLGSGNVSGGSSTSIPAPNPGSWVGNEGLILSLSLSSSAPAPQPTAAPPPPAAPPSGGSQPYRGSPISLPGEFDVVDYDVGGQGVAYADSTSGNTGGAYRSDDVDLQSSRSGGHHIGWTTPGEWLNYTVSVAETGSYHLSLDVAQTSSGGQISVQVGSNNVGTMTIPNTGDWNAFQRVSLLPVQLTAGTQVLRVNLVTAASNGWVSNLKRIAVSRATSSSPAPSPTQPPASGGSQPYTGTPLNLPGTIALRDYDSGGQGLAYHDTDAPNQGGEYRPTEGVDLQSSSEGGHNLGWVKAGEWLHYTVNVQQAGDYTLTLRSAGNGSGGTVLVSSNGRSTTLTVPKTATWQTYANTTGRMYLDAGRQVIRVTMQHSDATQSWVGNVLSLRVER